MKRKLFSILMVFICWLLLSAPAGAEQPVTAKEIAGTWTGELTVLEDSSTVGNFKDKRPYHSLTIEEMVGGKQWFTECGFQ